MDKTKAKAEKFANEWFSPAATGESRCQVVRRLYVGRAKPSLYAEIALVLDRRSFGHGYLFLGHLSGYEDFRMKGTKR